MIKLTYDNSEQLADVVILDGLLVQDDGFATSVAISLFSQARHEDEKGWWADTAEDRFGSKLWTLHRAKSTPENVRLAEDYAEDSLQWMIQDGIASDVSVVGEIAGGVLSLRTNVTRADGEQWSAVWEASLDAL